VKTIADVLKEDKNVISETVQAFAQEFNARNGGLQLREVAGGFARTAAARADARACQHRAAVCRNRLQFKAMP